MPEAWNNRAAIYQFVEKDYSKARKFYAQAIELAKKADNQRVLQIAQENLAHIPVEKALIPVKEHLSLEQFLNRFIAAAQASDNRAIRELVMGQKHNSQQAMDWFLDEALKASVDGTHDKENAALLLANVLAQIYQEAFNDPSLTVKKEELSSLSVKKRNVILNSESLMEQGLTHEQANAFDKALNAYQGALTGYKETGLEHKAGVALVYIGDVHVKLMKYDLAQSAYKEALPFFDHDGDAESRARVLASLGQACLKAQDYKMALKHMQASQKIYRKLKYEHEAKKLEKNIDKLKRILKD
jgi:tetratricopeptide (TPR) repeat protein